MTTALMPHVFWITSRAAGFAALILASLGVSLGLLMSTKLLARRGPDLHATHEIISLATIVAIVVHAATLLGDSYLKPSIADISIPFLSSYKSGWTSVGIVAGWAMILLGLSYYARKRIGAKRWRKLHRLTALAWVAGLVHSLGEGTDAGQVWFLAMLALVALPALALLAKRWLPLASGGVATPSGGRGRGDLHDLPARGVVPPRTARRAPAHSHVASQPRAHTDHKAPREVPVAG